MSDAKEEFIKEVNEKSADFLDKLRKEIITEPKQPDEFTITEVANKLQTNRRTTANIISKLFNEGKLTRREGHEPNGHPVMYYKYVE